MVRVFGFTWGSSSRRKRAGSWQGGVEVVDAEKQEKAIARRGNVGTCQRWMFIMGIPFVETEHDRPVLVEDLPEVIVDGSRLCSAKQRLIPPEAARHVCYADDRP